MELSAILPDVTAWDWLLVSGVTVQATVLSYLHHPRWKALLMTLPIPFTLASLSLGLPVDATNVWALLVLLGYTLAVYMLHARLGVPIIPVIVVCALGYCALGALLAAHIPRTEAAFWAASAVVFTIGLLLYRMLPERDEPGHRSPMPVPLKAAIIMLVILFIVVIKQYLQGFMTLFPMVGVIAAYEGRHCLWTLARQLPVIILTLLPMMIALHLLQPVVGIGAGLFAGWLVFFAVLIPLTRHQWTHSLVQTHTDMKTTVLGGHTDEY